LIIGRRPGILAVMAVTDNDAYSLYGDPRKVLERVLIAISDLEVNPSEPHDARVKEAIYYRATDDGREIVVYMLLMGTVRVVIGEVGELVFDDAWCYSTPEAGLLAASHWDGNNDPPEGWFRHLGSGRRRPEGDPAREYIAR
jgi:hypothetical protein